MIALDLSAPEHEHRWWPRPDLGTGVVRCTECAMTVPATTLSDREKVKVFAVHVLRVCFLDQKRPSTDAKRFASGQWQVYSKERPHLSSLEQLFWETFDREMEVLL